MADAKMNKMEIKLSDGRKLIYYVFSKNAEQTKQEENQTCQS
jgi:hypothetical protein